MFRWDSGAVRLCERRHSSLYSCTPQTPSHLKQNNHSDYDYDDVHGNYDDGYDDDNEEVVISVVSLKSLPNDGSRECGQALQVQRLYISAAAC